MKRCKECIFRINKQCRVPMPEWFLDMARSNDLYMMVSHYADAPKNYGKECETFISNRN